LVPCCDKTGGTLHLILAPLVHPKPRFPQWNGNIVMSFTSCGILNIAARNKIKSTSFSGPENANDPKCFAISLEQETSGMTVTSSFLKDENMADYYKFHNF
jgi:hypothetical protein